jgi:RNA polymerase sigma-70 factor (ECF subfamily)
MTTEQLDELLTRLRNGDAVAAEHVFRTFEPYLRMMVRRELRSALRAKFDSIDVVQSVWAEVLEGIQGGALQFNDSAHLHAFLIRLTKNRFLDRCRKHRRSVKSEESMTDNAWVLAVESPLPRPSEVARREELWEQMLALCPPAHHELLRLKLQGHAIAEIALQTGLHPGSVRRVLSDLARSVASANARSISSAQTGP